jgi:transcriptional regulator with XRE-family HTH domain
MAGQSKSRGYVREWMEHAQLRQTDLVTKLGYSKAKANAIWHGEQRLNEDIMEEIADLVHARTYELLMSPAVAHHFRRLEAVIADAVRPVEEPDKEARDASPQRLKTA